MTKREVEEYIMSQIFPNASHEVTAQNVRNAFAPIVERVWTFLEGEIGDLSQLQTTDKQSVVNAINAVLSKLNHDITLTKQEIDNIGLKVGDIVGVNQEGEYKVISILTDIANATKLSRYVTDNGLWKASTNTDVKSVVLKLSNCNEINLKLSTSAKTSSYIAILLEDPSSLANDTPVSFATGYTGRVSIAIGQQKNLEIKDDEVFVVIRVDELNVLSPAEAYKSQYYADKWSLSGLHTEDKSSVVNAINEVVNSTQQSIDEIMSEVTTKEKDGEEIDTNIIPKYTGTVGSSSLIENNGKNMHFSIACEDGDLFKICVPEDALATGYITLVTNEFQEGNKEAGDTLPFSTAYPKRIAIAKGSCWEGVVQNDVKYIIFNFITFVGTTIKYQVERTRYVNKSIKDSVKNLANNSTRIAILNSLRGNFETKVGNLSYVGEKIDLSDYKKSTYAYDVKMLNIDNIASYEGKSAQGFCVHGNIGFEFYDAGYCKCLDLSAMSILYSFMLPIGVANANNHCGQAVFGDEKYNASDEFPLLYLSSYLERKCYVLRMTRSSATLVQTIYLTDGTKNDGVYNLLDAQAFMVDTVNDKLVIKMGATSPNGVKYKFWKVFNMPTLSEGEIVYLFDEQKIDEFFLRQLRGYTNISNSKNFYNAGCIHNGKIYICVGFDGGTSRLHVIDYQNKVLLSDIKWSKAEMISKEQEECYISGGKMYINYNGADYIAEVSF